MRHSHRIAVACVVIGGSILLGRVTAAPAAHVAADPAGQVSHRPATGPGVVAALPAVPAPRTAPAAAAVAPPPAVVEPLGQRLVAAPSSIAVPAAEQAGVTVSIAVYDKLTGDTLVYNPAARIETASVVKLDILADVLVAAQNEHRALTAEENAVATPMIEQSDDNAANQFWAAINGDVGLTAFNPTLGLRDTVVGTDGWWGWTTTSVLDQLRVVNTFAYPNRVLSEASRAYALGLLNRVDGDIRWGQPAGPGISAWVKVGWMGNGANHTPGWRINSVGHVTGPGRDYTVAILTAGAGSEQAGIGIVNALGHAVYQAMSPAG